MALKASILKRKNILAYQLKKGMYKGANTNENQKNIKKMYTWSQIKTISIIFKFNYKALKVKITSIHNTKF